MWRYELVFHLRLEPPALKFDILPTAIGQLVDPDVSVLVRTPCPCFLARHLAVVCDMNDAPVCFFVIHAEVIQLGIARKERQEVWHLAISTHVYAFLLWEGKDRPERVGVGFAHRIDETHVGSRGRTCRGPVPVATGHGLAIV